MRPISKTTTSKWLFLTAIILAIGGIPHAQAPAGGAQDRVAAVKQSLQQGMALARRYEWVETTIISLKGEEKARKRNRCYYGADGKVQKVSLDAAPAPEPAQGGGRRGARVKAKIVEKKKDEMKDYMESAAALIHAYVPPDPVKIQAVKDAGRLTTAPQSGGTVRLTLMQYLKAGDALTIDVNASANQLAGLGVNSYLETPDDPVALTVQMATLADGALYAAQTTLEAPAKKITVVIQNSGHRKVPQ